MGGAEEGRDRQAAMGPWQMVDLPGKQNPPAGCQGGLDSPAHTTRLSPTTPWHQK